MSPNGFTSTMQNPLLSSVTTLEAGIYECVVTVAGCESASAQTTVVVNAARVISITSAVDPSNCGVLDGTITIDGLVAGTYTVLGGLPSPINVSGTSYTFMSLGAGAYTISIQGATGCVSNVVDTSLVDPNAPMAPNANNDGPVCAGTDVQLSTDSTGDSYSWTGPLSYTSSQQNPLLSGTTVSMSGSYCVTVTTNGCTSAATCTNVVIDAVPVITEVSSVDPTTCVPGDDGTITIGGLVGGTTYTIEVSGSTNSITPSGNTYQLTGLSSGTYVISVESAAGCESNSLSVVLNDPATPSAPTLSNDGPACEGDDVQLTASSVVGGTYAWSGPNGYTSTMQNPLLSGVTT